MSVDIPHHQIEIRWKIDHRCRVMKAHVTEGDKILAECEPTESQVVAQKAMLQKEDDQSDCAGN